MSLDLDAYNAAQGTPDAIWLAVHFYGRIRGVNLSDPAFIARGRAARSRASTYAGSGGAVGARSLASKQQAQVYTVLTYLGTTAEERRWGLRFVRAWLRGGRAAAERVLAQGGLSSGASAGTTSAGTTSAPRGGALGPWLAQQAGAVQQRRQQQQQQARSPYRSPFQASAPAAPRYPTPVVAAPSFQPSFRASPPPGAATRPREDRAGGLVIDLDAYRRQGPTQPRVRWDASDRTFRRDDGGGSGPSATVAPFATVAPGTRLPPTGLTAATSIAPTLDNVALSTDEASSPYSGLGAAPIGASPYDRVKPFLLPAAALLVAALVASQAGGASAGSSSRRRRNGRRARRNQSPKTRR